MRSYRDLACGTIRVAIMIVAVLHVALDPLDVLAAARSLILLVLFHFEYPLCHSDCESLTSAILIVPAHFENML